MASLGSVPTQKVNSAAFLPPHSSTRRRSHLRAIKVFQHSDLQPGVTVTVQTKYGPLRGGRATNGAAVFLEVPYALPPVRFQDPQPLPEGYRYEDKHYVFETKHCYQPTNIGDADDDQNGFGNPSEDPLFVNIVAPSSFSSVSKFPVKVYIHGGFLQTGAPHELQNQAQYVSQERSEIWVNIGYRLSVLGFLACDEPRVDGNFGFKDQWFAMVWIRDNIATFGGDPENIQITGHSAGGHSVHQILHHISRLPAGQSSPIRSARLQSNAIVISPKTPAECRPQFEALCHALGFDPKLPNILDILRDLDRVPAKDLIRAIETNVGVQNAAFLGCMDGVWMDTNPDPMTWQRSGDFGRRLREKGVKSVTVGNVSEEWYYYSTFHPINTPADIIPYLLRYYPRPIVEALVSMYPRLPDTAAAEESQRLFGEILSNGQINIPVRLLARDLQRVDFPVLRYEIGWVAGRDRSNGHVSHGSDRSLWAVRVPNLGLVHKEKALEWLDMVDKEVKVLEREGRSNKPVEWALMLKEDQSIAWSEDARWERLLAVASVLPSEQDR